MLTMNGQTQAEILTTRIRVLQFLDDIGVTGLPAFTPPTPPSLTAGGAVDILVDGSVTITPEPTTGQRFDYHEYDEATSDTWGVLKTYNWIVVVVGGRIMSSLARHGGLAARGGIAGRGGGFS